MSAESDAAVVLTRDEAIDLMAWFDILNGYRNLMLMRVGNNGAEETSRFLSEHPAAQSAMDKIGGVR